MKILKSVVMILIILFIFNFTLGYHQAVYAYNNNDLNKLIGKKCVDCDFSNYNFKSKELNFNQGNFQKCNCYRTNFSPKRQLLNPSTKVATFFG